MAHLKSRLEFRLAIAKKQDPKIVEEKWLNYMNDYDNLSDKTISDKIHLRESFFSYMNYMNKYKGEKK